MNVVLLILAFHINSIFQISKLDGNDQTVVIAASLMPAVQNALRDFQKRNPNNWKCYNIYISKKKNNIEIMFGSDQKILNGIEYVGDAGKCGPSIIYTVTKYGSIIKTRGVR